MHSDSILDTLETFLETCPALEGQELWFDERETGENPTVRMMKIDIGGEEYLVVVKRVGG